MIRLAFFQTTHKKQGQALVEFSLTLLVFLLLLVMIIEVARILFAFVTLQHAARMGARYAITGQWLEQYALDPTAGWDSSSDNPLDRIPPCWPRFDDDPYSPTPNDYTYYEPYRNARTCSIEEKVLIGMRGLPLEPDALSGMPGYYLIRVSGVAEDRYPTTGSFWRNSSELQYSSYFSASNPEFQGANSGLSPGYAGLPQQKVVVQIYYRLPVITPLLSSIAESVVLKGTAVMTNEAYGSTGVQRQAILPPDLPPVDPLDPPSPPDLVVVDITLAETPPLSLGTPANFDVTVSNLGSYNVADGFELRLYASTTPLGLPPWSGLTPLGVTSLAGLDAGASHTSTFTVSFASEGAYTIYAWVDAGDSLEGAISEANEQNNTLAYAQVVQVGDAIDLVFASKTPDRVTANAGESVTYTMEVDNAGTADATGVFINDTLPAGLTFVSSSDCSASGSDVQCSLGDLPSGGSRSVAFTAQVDAGASGNLINSASVGHTGGELEVVMSNNDITSVPVVVGGVDVSLGALVDNAAPLTGESITYTLTVTNASSNAASGVEVTSALPAGVTPPVGYDPVWVIGDLAGGASASRDITVDITATSGQLTALFTITALDQPNASSTTQATVIVTVQNADLQVTKEVSPLTAAEGESITYTIRVVNTGPNPATGVQVIDLLPAGLVFQSADGDYDELTGLWTVGDLDVSGGRVLNITAAVATGSGNVSTVTNQINAADVTADQADPNPSNNQPSVDLLVNAKADLELDGGIAVNGGAQTTTATAAEGDTVTFSLTVTNNGPNDATGVQVTSAYDDTADAHLTLTNISNPAALGEDGTWTIGDLAAGSSATLTIEAVVNERTSVLTLTNTARVIRATPQDDVPGNDTLSTSLTLTPTPVDLSLAVSPASASREYYETISYSITLTNHSASQTATGIEVSVVDLINLDGSVLDLDPIAAPSGSTYNASTGRWTVTSLPAGASKTLTITGTVVDSSAQGGTRTYPGSVNVLSFDQWDPTTATASWTLSTTWPAPLYVQLGNSNCNQTINWGSPTGGQQNGHALIGRDVAWVPVTQLSNVTASNGTSGSTNVYAPAGSTWPTTRGTQLSTSGGYGSDAALFYCRSEGNSITVSITDLAPGTWELTLLFYEPSTSSNQYTRRDFSVTANGSTVLPGGFNIYAAAGQSQMVLIVQSGQSVQVDGSPVSVPNVSVPLASRALDLQFTRTSNRSAVVSAIGLEYVSGP